MALVVNDRVKETSTTTGTVTFTLDGAVTGFETFSSAIGNGNTTYYAIEIPNTAEFEVGLGTVSAGQLARTQVFSSSNSDALVDFSAGTKNVFCTLPASKFVPGKLEGTNFTNSILIGHATTGTLNAAQNNLGVGIDALDALTSGDSNVAIGYNAGTAITSGGFNVLMGRNAGEGITTTFTTTAIGDQSFKTSNTNNNTGLGASAGLHTLGGDNTAIGRSAGQGTAGQSSYTNATLLGNDAGKALTTGSHNILLGSTSGDNLTTGSGNVLIGSGIDADAVDSARTLKIVGYDGSTTTTWISGDSSGNLTFPADLTVDTDTLYVDSTNDRIGIGTTSPTYTLESLGSGTDGAFAVFHNQGSGGVYSGVQIASANQLGGGNSDTNLTITRWNGVGTKVSAVKLGVESNNNDGVLTFSTAENADFNSSTYTERMRIDGDTGNVGIGTTSPSAKLDVSHSAADIGSFIRNNNSGSGQIKLGNSDGFVRVGGNNGTFEVYNSSNTSARLFIDNVGNVGLGNNTSPSSLLHLSSSDPQITITDTDGSGSQVIKAVGDDLVLDSPNDVTIDAAAEINLDTDNSSVRLKDGGTEYGRIHQISGGGLVLKAQQSDKDLRLEGVDGGSSIVALTLDMSEAGDAIFNSNIFLGDNKKANFGAGNDLQIYHDGTQSIIEDAGTGQLKILAENTLYMGSATGTEKYIRALKNGIVELSYDNSAKLTTSSTGIDVTGTAVTDGLTVAGNVSVDGGTIKLDGNYPTGTNNVAMGDTALDSIGTGGAGHNVAIGHAALTADDTGTGNVGIGAFALTSTVTGNYSTAIGQEALKVNTASWNNAIGFQSMLTSVGGEKNIAMGFWSLKNLGSNDKNVAIGHEAGINLTGGDNNIIIGHNAQAASATTSNQITLGDANITSLRIPGLQSGASSGDVLTYDGTDIGFSTPSTGVSAGFAVAMAIAL
jgi:hypothetical protein